MKPKPGHFKLGLFVLLSLGLVVAGLIALGAASVFKPKIKAETYLAESVAGLEVGSPVRHLGVVIGKVSAIGFLGAKYEQYTIEKGALPGQYIHVEMELDPDKLKPLTVHQIDDLIRKMVDKGLRVRIVQSVLTGSAYLETDYVDPQKYPPPKLDWTPTTLYIPSAPSQFQQLSTGLEKFMADLEQADLPGTLRHLDSLIVDTNRSVNELQVAALREKFAALLDEVKLSSTRVQEILANPSIDATVNDLPVISSRLKSSAASMDRILQDPSIPAILKNLDGTSHSANVAAADLRHLLRRLEVMVTVQGRDVEALLTNLRQTSENVEAISEEAKGNPARLIFGQPPPRKKPGEQP